VEIFSKDRHFNILTGIMETIFITPDNVYRPEYYTKFYRADGSTFLRMDDVLSKELLHSQPDIIKIELYRNTKEHLKHPELLYNMDINGIITRIMQQPANKSAALMHAKKKTYDCTPCLITTIAPH
jgi:hypothetical protein